MLTLYITRHGETEWNREMRLQGWKDSELTENGVENAVCLGKALKEISIDAVYSSPSNRTAMTTRLICGDRNIPIIFDDLLKEINMGVWEGNTQSTIEENHPEEFHNFWNAPHNYKPIGGETFLELYERVQKAINRIITNHQSGNILIVTHTVVIKCLCLFFKNAPIENVWAPPYIYDTSLTVVEVDGNDYRILIEGDISHKEIGIIE